MHPIAILRILCQPGGRFLSGVPQVLALALSDVNIFINDWDKAVRRHTCQKLVTWDRESE